MLSNRQPIFVPNAKIGDWTVNQQRVQAAIDYGIQSICFLPVLGGVLEVGNSDACVASGNTWEGVEAVTEDGLPKAELERAFRSGATYAIYWKPDYAKGEHGLRALVGLEVGLEEDDLAHGLPLDQPLGQRALEHRQLGFA